MKCESCCCWLVCVLLLATAYARSVSEVKSDASEVEQKVECASVSCGPLCREAVGQSGCPTCLCDPACSPPKCDPGCRVHFDPALGPCPGCVCDGKEDENQNISSYVQPELIPLPKCQCDWRYLKHYATKKCSPVFEEGCDCPIRFDCPEPPTAPENVCEYKGKTYQLGEAIETSSSCEICSCGKSFFGGVEISCIPIECPSLFRPPPDEGCYEVYEADKCCSVDVKCTHAESGKLENITEPTCEYGGKTYHLGQRIYPEEDPCMSCFCDENWAGINSNSCRVHECLIERNLGDLKRGCIPIYHEKTCCPIEFHCGTGSEENLNDTLTPKSDGACVFEGKSYSVGEQLDIKHPTNCVTCTCRTPPDFTCVHLSCPRPPNDDYENCIPTYEEGQCCATYDCRQPLPRYECEPVECRNVCKEVYGPHGCAICLCNEVLCTPPKCPDRCVVEYDVPAGSCPRCKCPITVQFAPVQCAPVKCDPECFEAFGSDGCLMCLCGPLCSAPKCDEGCSVQTDVHQGQCPGCVCSTSLDHSLLDGRHQEIQCAPVKCPPACREVQGEFGCPTCLCGPLCSPPRCDPGCEIETVPSSGPCPGCVCRDQPTHNIQCSPVKCDPGCLETTGDFGCPACTCDPLCSPPKCDPGCEIELVPSSGPCPGCVCKNDQISAAGVQCAPVKCGRTCREAIGDFGCPTCLCDPLCSPPKCDPGCEVETAPFSGPCPGCVCGGLKTAGIQCAPVKCGPTCHEEVGDFGCPTCRCDPLCSPPKCDPGCEVETAPFSGPCPGCVCGELKRTAGVQCAPVKCGPTCREAVGDFGCPTCLCDPLCSPPKCDPGCEVETAPFSGPCPGCVCGRQKTSDIQCAPVKCAPTCREAIGESGCPTCLCDPLCSPPKCDPGCEIETAPFSGPCPGCVCGDKKGLDLQCAPVKCGPQCREAVGQYGCPVCLCDPLCSPPKCDPGCEIETEPFSGPCPGCVCKDQLEQKVQCAPVKCGPLCREAVGDYGCATCHCDPACSPPKCDPGCRVEVVPSLGPCPGCVCDEKKDSMQIKIPSSP